jgi:hypothetical protein
MRVSRFSAVIIVASACAILTSPRVWAQIVEPNPAAQAIRQEIDQLKKDFEERLTALEARLATLAGGQAPAPVAPTVAAPTAEVPQGAAGAGGPTGALPVYGNVSAASKIFNPDIAVLGNFVGALGKNQVRPDPVLQVKEAEISLQAIVDPYARADFFLAFTPEGAELEEGYITFPTLPGGLLGKVGKQRWAFGKVNMSHSHQVPWIDRPLMTDNLVGGEEGLNDAGLSIARLVPNPWLFLEATAQVYRGTAGDDIFVSNRRRDISVTSHLRAYQDITESTNVDLGMSFARGHNGTGVDDGTDLTTKLYGIDATLRWRPLQRSIYRSFVARSEVVWSRRNQPDGLQNASGFFVSGDYQFGRRWFTGARFDRSGRADNRSLRDKGGSLTLTYWPSEFSQVRGQLRRTLFAEGPKATEFLFQFMFNIGAHGAHPF